MGYEEESPRRKFQGAGGTPGGIPEFFVGVLMAGLGAYLVLSRIHVTSGWHIPWLGHHGTFGTVLSMFLLGIFVLFIDGGSWIGRGLTAAGLFLMLFGVINSLHVYFTTTTLLNTLLMFGMLAGGLGLVARSLQPH